MKVSFWLTLIGVLCLVQVKAQDTIVYFDRPGIGDGPYITQKGKLNIESGFSYASVLGWDETYLPGILSRYQLTSASELRIMVNYEPQSLKFILHDFQNGYDPISIGFKRRLARTPDCFADMGFGANLFYPMQKFKNFDFNTMYFDSYLLFEHNAPSGSYINYSIGYIYGGGEMKSMAQWSLAGNLYVGKILLFAEYFGYYQFIDQKVETGFDAGVIYEFNGNMQVDFSVIYNQYGIEKALFYALGYSISIPVKK